MKNKKNYVIILAAVCVVLLIVGAVYFIAKSSATDENSLTRYEWLELIGERFGINEYINESPYFKGVDSNNPYFSYVQSAVEWEIINTDSNFEGENSASGQFVALTAMKAIGENKLQIYLDIDDDITEDKYIELAIEYGLIEEERLKKGLSEEECEQVLDTLYDLYFSEFWKDDYSRVTYQNDVIELSSEDILQSNADYSEIVAADNIANSLEAGTIIVFEHKNTKLKLAREITEISSDGTLSLGPVELEQVVESLRVSDITELTFQDIINYYGLEENTNTINNLQYQQTDTNVISTKVFPVDMNSKGYKLSLSTEGEGKSKYLKIEITENETGITYELPIREKVEPDDEYNAEVDIDKICIGGQASYSIWNGLEYADAAVDAHATFKCTTFEAKKDKKFLLFNTPVPLGNGLVGADIQIYGVLKMDGSISFEAELPVEVSISYEKNKGLRYFKHNISIKKSRIEANCNASAMLRIEPTLVLLGCANIVDAEADIGVSASAKIAAHSNGQICADVQASFPVITILVSGDDDAYTILKDLGLSAEWEIISSDDAPIKIGFHYEQFPDKTVQFVDECSYGKQIDEEKYDEEQKKTPSGNTGLESEATADSSEALNYAAYELPIQLWVNTPFEDHGGYYTVKGNLQIAYAMHYSDFDKISNGESFTIQDKQFIKEKPIQSGNSLVRSVYCVDDDCTYYMCAHTGMNFGSRFGSIYYVLCRSIPDEDAFIESMDIVSNDLGEHEFRIEKDVYITSLMEMETNHMFPFAAFDAAGLSDEDIFEYKEKQRKEGLARFAHTAEECFENLIFLDDWIDIMRFSSAYGDIDYPLVYYIVFDENNTIDTVIFSSF